MQKERRGEKEESREGKEEAVNRNRKSVNYPLDDGVVELRNARGMRHSISGSLIAAMCNI